MDPPPLDLELGGAVLVDGGVFRLRSSFATWEAAKRQLAPPLLAGTPLDSFRAGLARWSPVPLTPEVEAIFLSLMRVDGQGRIHPRLSRANHFRILRAIWDQDAPALHAVLTVPTLAILAHGSADAAAFDVERVDRPRDNMERIRAAQRVGSAVGDDPGDRVASLSIIINSVVLTSSTGATALTTWAP